MSPSNDSLLEQAPSKAGMKRKRLARLVSQEQLGLKKVTNENANFLNGTPTGYAQCELGNQSSSMEQQIEQPNGGSQERNWIISYESAARLEAELLPMRQLLHRLMSHPSCNRKGIFNSPVDVEGLGLLNYFDIVKKPMDLGTIKERLFAVAYGTRAEAADDIRLVFSNAMLFNPPSNPVHKAAEELLSVFEKQYDQIVVASCTKPTLAADRSSVRPATDVAPNTPPDTIISAVNEKQQLSRSEGDSLDAVMPVVDFGSSSTNSLHSCSDCKGRMCKICGQGCLLHEPSLITCDGVHCHGAKIRKGSTYFLTRDGHRHFCQRCSNSLTQLLPGMTEGDPHCYKKDLLRRKSDEEIVEKWISCSVCSNAFHSICAMHSEHLHQSGDYKCFDCKDKKTEQQTHAGSSSVDGELYTYLSGCDSPVPMSSFSNHKMIDTPSVQSLSECPISRFIQEKVATRLASTPFAGRTVSVRVVSDCERLFHVPSVVKRHFRMDSDESTAIDPPSKVRYRQKAIMLFQRIDGLDVSIFCMYVHEYDGDDVFDTPPPASVRPRHQKRVYIAYIDSVDHFRPRKYRTDVYYEVVAAYLASARGRGFEAAQIWACPPSRGNSFIFWNHPASQRTPNRDRLLDWYHGALSRAVGYGVVTDVESLYDSDFNVADRTGPAAGTQEAMNGRTVCPPLLDGDFWIDEATRVHAAHMNRNVKVRATSEVCVWNVLPLSSDELDSCPATQIAILLRDRIMTHPASVPFRRPVNAAAMKLKDYHKIVPHPMDLGTIHARCVIGEYNSLSEVLDDLTLMVENAKRFNPAGHYVHSKADEVRNLFFKELEALVNIWNVALKNPDNGLGYKAFLKLSMSLDRRMALPESSTTMKSCAVIEDDRSSDGSRSMVSSVVSLPNSPTHASAQAEITPQTDSSACKRRGKGRGRRSSINKSTEPRKDLSLFTDGPEAVRQKMVGSDFWLLDKRNPACRRAGTKTGNKRRSSLTFDDPAVKVEEPASKRRKQSWLGQEVGYAVRRQRTTFFTCHLTPRSTEEATQHLKIRHFNTYASSFAPEQQGDPETCRLSDSRQAILEFSQYQNLEFNTLRKAKYSTAVLISYLCKKEAPGLVPACTKCMKSIDHVRWHKVRRSSERRSVKGTFKQIAKSEDHFIPMELCGSCHDIQIDKEEFIPIPVTIK